MRFLRKETSIQNSFVQRNMANQEAEPGEAEKLKYPRGNRTMCACVGVTGVLSCLRSLKKKQTVTITQNAFKETLIL